MEPFRDDTDLIAELRALRPAPRPAFAAELDERAAAGFRRQSTPADSSLGRLVARVRAVQPRRLLVPVGATALTAVVIATAVVAVNESGTGRPARTQSGAVATSAGPRPDSGKLKPFSKSYERYGESLGSGSSGIAGGAGKSGRLHSLRNSSSSLGGSSAGQSSTASVEAVVPTNRSDSLASKAAHREVERSAEVVLGADPTDVGKDAARVFEAVHAHRGIVLSSSVRDGASGEAGARFDLLIPSAKLGDALAAFSAIAEVRSRHEATADITAPTVRSGELLQDSRARIDGLLAQLSRADTDSERTAAEAELRAERRHNAYLRSQLSALQRRATFSRVSLRIETGSASTSTDQGGGGWGVGDAVRDAGHILAIAAGVTIIGLAVLAPLGLIILLAWLTNRARIRRGRERALT